jgi:type III secretion protein Q
MSPRRLVLPRLSRAEAAAARARSAPRAALTVLMGPFRLFLDDGGTGDFGPDQVRVSFLWGADRLELRCPAALPQEILRVLEPGLDTASLPSDLAGLLLEGALLPALMGWERASGRDVVVLSMEKDASMPSKEGLRLMLEDGAKRWRLHLCADDVGHGGAHSALTALIDLWPVAPRPMARFVLPALLRLGTTWLPVAALGSLRPDDAILLETHSGHGNGMLVIAETWISAARTDAGLWRVVETPRGARNSGRTEWTMEIDRPSAEGPGAELIADPDELPVQLAFEVGRLEIMLGDLRKLGPGSVLELSRSRDELVRVTAQGRLIGHGELVEVEGAVAVRMVQLFDYG